MCMIFDTVTVLWFTASKVTILNLAVTWRWNSSCLTVLTMAIDFAVFCEPIQKALRSFGVPVDISRRNDMTVEEKKCSGNAQYLKQGRIMHHGTILYDSDLDVLSQALNGAGDKIESKGIKSVRSRVTNIRPYMKTPISEFWAALKEFMFAAFDMGEYTLSPEENAEVEKLRKQTYSQWN